MVIFPPIASSVIHWLPDGGQPDLVCTTPIFPFTPESTKESGTIVSIVTYSLKTIKSSVASIAMNTIMRKKWPKNTMKYPASNSKVWRVLGVTQEVIKKLTLLLLH
jgi:hypothetical protein